MCWYVLWTLGGATIPVSPCIQSMLSMLSYWLPHSRTKRPERPWLRIEWTYYLYFTSGIKYFGKHNQLGGRNPINVVPRSSHSAGTSECWQAALKASTVHTYRCRRRYDNWFLPRWSLHLQLQRWRMRRRWWLLQPGLWLVWWGSTALTSSVDKKQKNYRILENARSWNYILKIAEYRIQKYRNEKNQNEFKQMAMWLVVIVLLSIAEYVQGIRERSGSKGPRAAVRVSWFWTANPGVTGNKYDSTSSLKHLYLLLSRSPHWSWSLWDESWTPRFSGGWGQMCKSVGSTTVMNCQSLVQMRHEGHTSSSHALVLQ